MRASQVSSEFKRGDQSYLRLSFGQFFGQRSEALGCLGSTDDVDGVKRVSKTTFSGCYKLKMYFLLVCWGVHIEVIKNEFVHKAIEAMCFNIDMQLVSEYWQGLAANFFVGETPEIIMTELKKIVFQQIF